MPLSWSLASKLADLSDAELGRDLACLLAACVGSCLQHPEAERFAPSDQQIAIKACTRLVGLLEEDAEYAKALRGNAAAFYQGTLEPILATADRLAGATAGSAEDAEAVLQLEPDSRGAHGLRCHAYLIQARQQPTRVDRLEHLDAAIASGEQAVEGCPETDPSLPASLVNLSGAYVERALLTRDPTFEKQRQDLEQAIRHAERADELLQTTPRPAFPHYPCLALGNAYEDLAWLVESDPATRRSATRPAPRS